jgi:hypothetical protein
MKLVLGIYAQLGQPSDPTASHPATPSEAPETSSTAVADEVDDQDDEDAAAQDPRRPPFAVRRDGWLTVSDPVDFVCHAWRRNAKDVGRGARRVDAPPGIIDEQKDAATRNSSSEPPGKILSGAAGSSMGFFSFVDYDHEWNTAPIFVVTRACAEVLQGSSHVAFTSSTKLHPLGMHLPSRAAAAAGGGSSSVKGTAGRRGSFTSDQSQSHNEASSSKKTRAGTAGGTQPAAAQSQREASGGGVAADDAKTAAAPAAASPCSTAEQQPIKEAAAHSGSLKAPEEGKAVPRRRRPLAEATSDTLEL